MFSVERIGSYISRGVYTVSGPFHPFGGAVDIIVVQQPDGSFKSAPWYVRFGKFQGVLKSKEKVVRICVNGVEAGFNMYLDHKGEAYFLSDLEGEEGESLFYRSSSGDETERQSSIRRPQKSKSCNFESEEPEQSNLVNQIDASNVKLLGRTKSRRSRILGIFGRRSMKENSFRKEEVDSGMTRSSSLERAEIAADLLEMKWSTNLATCKPRKDHASRFSDSNLLGGNVQVEEVCNDKQVKENSFTDDKQYISLDINEEICKPINNRASDVDECSVYPLEVEPCESKHSDNKWVSSDTCYDEEEVLKEAYGDEALHGGADPIPEVKPLPECGLVVVAGENLNDLVLQKIGDFCDRNDENIIQNEGMLISSNRDSVVPESISSIEAEVSTELEVIQQSAVIERIPDEISFEAAVENYLSWNENKEVDLEKAFDVQDSDIQLVSVDSLRGSIEEIESCSIRTIQNIQLGESSVESTSTSSMIFEESIEKARTLSSPTDIPKRQEIHGLARSLPNMWSNAANRESIDVSRRLSRSLDSNSKCTSLKNGFSSSIKLVVGKECETPWKQLTIEEALISGELKDVFSNPAVEVSLCRHLLYEGVGLEAASEAFDAEKLDKDTFASLGLDIMKNERLVVRIGSHYYPWEAASPIVLGMASFGSGHIFEPKGMISIDKALEIDPSKSIAVSGGRWGIWPFSRGVKAVQPPLNGSRRLSLENDPKSTIGMGVDESGVSPRVTKKKVRLITPTSDQLASLNLREGMNMVTFTFSTSMLGKQQVDARIYLWKYDTRIVISDVDGTITKSDVLGQFMPMMGVDWSQTGVAHLFTDIKKNGYQLLFLSARAISQAYHTRQFLFNLKQDGKALPDGPVIISPDGLFPSLFREVIRRAPHEFKIGCLEDIRALFPSEYNPFYAGFGNRDSDEISYLKVGIPKGKIFIINPRGEVAVNRRVDTKSYTSIHALVHGMFPPVLGSSEQEDFNSWNFWKLPPPVLDM